MPVYASCTYHELGASTLQAVFLVHLQTHGFAQVPKAKGQERSLINKHVQYLWRCNKLWAATAKFKFCQYLYARFRTKNLKTTNISGYTVVGLCSSWQTNIHTNPDHSPCPCRDSHPFVHDPYDSHTGGRVGKGEWEDVHIELKWHDSQLYTWNPSSYLWSPGPLHNNIRTHKVSAVFTMNGVLQWENIQ